jgi:hypothetical protein
MEKDAIYARQRHVWMNVTGWPAPAALTYEKKRHLWQKCHL